MSCALDLNVLVGSDEEDLVEVEGGAERSGEGDIAEERVLDLDADDALGPRGLKDPGDLEA